MRLEWITIRRILSFGIDGEQDRRKSAEKPMKWPYFFIFLFRLAESSANTLFDFET
jgi:hypothetical protein